MFDVQRWVAGKARAVEKDFSENASRPGLNPPRRELLENPLCAEGVLRATRRDCSEGCRVAGRSRTPIRVAALIGLGRFALVPDAEGARTPPHPSRREETVRTRPFFGRTRLTRTQTRPAGVPPGKGTCTHRFPRRISQIRLALAA
jgi:hypothetical protein